MSAADTLFEISQLSEHIPVTHAVEPGGIGWLHAPAISTVTGSAGRIRPLTVPRVPLRRGRGMIVRQRLDVSDDVIYCGVIAQRRRHRCHHFTENVFFVRATGTDLEIF